MYQKKKFDKNSQQKKIERIQKYYAEMNAEPEKVAKYVREKTIEWLSESDKTRFQIEEKIFKNIDKVKHNDLVSKILNEYEERGYLSDDRFAENFIRIKYESSYGVSKIKNELKKKGLNPDKYLFHFENYDFFESAEEYVKRKTENKVFSNKEIESFQRQMISRGFSFNEISPAMEFITKKDIVIDNDEDFDFSKTIKHIEKLAKKGYGENKIKQELKYKGLEYNDELLEKFDFFEIAKEYKIKKYGIKKLEDYNEINKQKQHLLSRGFNFDQVNYALE